MLNCRSLGDATDVSMALLLFQWALYVVLYFFGLVLHVPIISLLDSLVFGALCSLRAADSHSWAADALSAPELKSFYSRWMVLWQ